jgi:hypothetical protein
MPCTQKDMLLAAYRNSTALYSMSVKQLSEVRATAPREMYEDIRKLTEDARQQCERDRLELEGHVNAHRC